MIYNKYTFPETLECPYEKRISEEDVVALTARVFGTSTENASVIYRQMGEVFDKLLKKGKPFNISKNIAISIRRRTISTKFLPRSVKVLEVIPSHKELCLVVNKDLVNEKYIPHRMYGLMGTNILLTEEEVMKNEKYYFGECGLRKLYKGSKFLSIMQ